VKIEVNKKQFIDYLVGPASKIADNLLLTTKQDKENSFLKTLTYSSDSSIILQSSIPYKGDIFDKLFIPEVKTFIRLLGNVEEENLHLSIVDNTILYTSNSFSFKYHLLDETYFNSKKSINEEKINAVKYSLRFVTTKNKFSDILKFNSIIPDAEKLYILQTDNKVVAKLGDKQKPNVNEIQTILSDSFEGEFKTQDIPINIQNVIMLSFSDTYSINVSINQELKILKFESGPLSYILSGLVK
jgi:hypothetical protein